MCRSEVVLKSRRKGIDYAAALRRRFHSDLSYELRIEFPQPDRWGLAKIEKPFQQGDQACKVDIREVEFNLRDKRKPETF